MFVCDYCKKTCSNWGKKKNRKLKFCNNECKFNYIRKNKQCYWCKKTFKSKNMIHRSNSWWCSEKCIKYRNCFSDFKRRFNIELTEKQIDLLKKIEHIKHINVKIKNNQIGAYNVRKYTKTI
jgi:hypothetical protein